VCFENNGVQENPTPQGNYRYRKHKTFLSLLDNYAVTKARPQYELCRSTWSHVSAYAVAACTNPVLLPTPTSPLHII